MRDNFRKIFTSVLAPGVGGGAVYANELLAIAPASLVQLLPISETSGTTALDVSENAYNGTYSGVTLNSIASPGGSVAGLWTPNTSYLDNYNAGLNTPVQAQELTYNLWYKPVSQAEMDVATLRVLCLQQANGNNYIYVNKQSDDFNIEYRAGSTTKSVQIATVKKYDWMNIAFSISKAGDFMKVYLDFVLRGTVTGLGTWAGSLSNATTLLGAFSKTPTYVQSGYLSHFAAWSTPFDQTNISALRPSRTEGKKQIIFDGDSLTVGDAAAPNTYPAQLLAMLGSSWEGTVAAVNGQTTSNLLTDAATQIDSVYQVLRPRNVVAVWIGTNDLKNSVAVATAFANLLSYVDGRILNGYEVVVLTLLPRSGDTPVDFEANRQAYNTLIRDNAASHGYVVADVGADETIGDEGDNLDTDYYDDDQIHQIAAGCTIVANYVYGVL